MEHLDSQATPAPPALEPGPLLHPTSSLSSLPDELLALVVDQALGEHAPRLYKDRQQTGIALSLVNKRVGGIAQPKLVEAVHIEVDEDHADALSPRAELVAVGAPSRSLALCMSCIDGTQTVCAPQYLYTFTNLRHLSLVDLADVDLDELTQLPELRELVLSNVALSASRPFVAAKLRSLTLYRVYKEYYGELTVEGLPALLTVQGVPALEHLYFGGTPTSTRGLYTENLLARLRYIGVEAIKLTAYGRAHSVGWAGQAQLGSADLDKILFDLPVAQMPLIEYSAVSDVRHLRIYSHSIDGMEDLDAVADAYDELTYYLAKRHPDLVTLYVAAGLDPSCVMLPRKLNDAMVALEQACAYQGVELVFEGSCDEYIVGESRRSARFEARCRRIEAERAAAAASAPRA